MASARILGLRLALRIAAVAPAIAATALADAWALEPPPFSGANCSMTSCDCNCIAAEQQKGAAAITKLEIDLPNVLSTTRGRLTPQAALSRLEYLNRKINTLLLALQVARTDPAGSMPLSRVHSGVAAAFRELQLPPPPTGWDFDERYVSSLEGSIRSELARATVAVDDEKFVRQEIDTCRRWADHKQCDPSLGTQPPTPAREQPPAPPPSVTPPRQMWPPDQPQPFARHPDGRPIVDDDLLTRYVAARKTQIREGGAYWRQGGFGQADFADVHQRVDAWARSVGSASVHELFDEAELEAFKRREKEVREAYTGSW